MLRFLKYIFLIFGGLALSVMIFFFVQNKEDLSVVWEYKNKLSYEKTKKECVKKELFICFKNEFNEFSDKVSLTGLSLGLKLAFNYLEKSKSLSKSTYKDIEYALKHLEINNIVIAKTNNRFHGFKTLYGGYIGKMIDFLKSAKEFSKNLMIGLEKSPEGLKSIKNNEVKARFEAEYLKIKQKFNDEVLKIETFIEKQVKFLKDKYE